MAATRASRSSTGKSTDAVSLLKADHDKVKKMFKEFERLHEAEADEEAEQIAKQICNELTIHATVEEEIFYPEVRAAIDDDDLLDEAEVEHASAKDLIAQIEGMSASDDKFAAKVIVLGEYINHHVKEEHDEMFPKAKKADLDLQEMGARIQSRKQELKAEMSIEDDGEAEAERKMGGPGAARNGSKPSHAGR